MILPFPTRARSAAVVAERRELAIGTPPGVAKLIADLVQDDVRAGRCSAAYSLRRRGRVNNEPKGAA